MTRLISAILKLRPLQRAIIPRTHGKLIHGAFVSMLAGINEALAFNLHGGARNRPYTLSNLIGEREVLATSLVIEKDAECYVRVTSLDDGLTGLIDALSAKLPSLTLKIGESQFLLEAAITESEKHPLAAESSFESLAGSWGSPEARTPGSVRFDFTSPTCFRKGDINLVLPTPALLFESLSENWKRSAGGTMAAIIEAEFDDLMLPASGSTEKRGLLPIDDVVLVEQFALRTHMLDFGQFKRIGFTGDLTLVFAPGVPARWKRLVAMLAEFAVFAGVGYQTTMGMGQVEVTVL